MLDKIKQIEISAKEKINAAKNSNEIEELRVAFLGKKGKVVEVLKNLKNVEADKRKEVASFANNVKSKIEEGMCVKAVQGNAMDLSLFEDNTFDMALLFGPMYHLFTFEDKLKALNEAKRVVKPGGMKIYLKVWDLP